MKRIKVNLTEAGKPGRSSVVDADTGDTIENVRAITIRAAVGEPTKVTIELIGIEVEGDITTLDDAFEKTRYTPGPKASQ